MKCMAQGRLFFERDAAAFPLLMRWLRGNHSGVFEYAGGRQVLEQLADDARFFKVHLLASIVRSIV